MLNAAREKLGLSKSNSEIKKGPKNRIFLPQCELLPYIRSNALFKEMNMSAESVHDYLSKLLAFLKTIRHNCSKYNNTTKDICEHCNANVFEDTTNGHFVCESCGIVASNIITAIPFEKTDPFCLPANLKLHYMRSSSCSHEDDQKYRLKKRIGDFLNSKVNFDEENVLDILMNYKKEENEISNPCIFAAILISKYREDIEEFKLPSPPSPMSICRNCNTKFFRRIDERHHKCYKIIKKPQHLGRNKPNVRTTKYIHNM